MDEASYRFTCPSCVGTFSIQLDRIPPVQARFRCPHCKQPMDFPSRDEARVYARLQAAAPAPESRDAPPSAPAPSLPKETPKEEATASGASEGTRFQVRKAGFEADQFDRRGMRNLIRSGEILENDRLSVDGGEPVLAGDLPYLKSLFALRKTTKTMPPTGCRTHTDQVAFFMCKDTGRPLCEECAPEKKFGGTTIRVCSHCGGTAGELDHKG